ncbi:MAG: 3-hydroxyisobutyrate dehydrogenase [Pseudomonadota bacterium]
MTDAIAFIGLGTMGMPMALCLERNGKEVIGWDLDAAARQSFGNSTETLAGLTRHCQTFITMLPEGEHVRQVYSQLLASGVMENSLFIDCSTIDVGSARELAGQLDDRGHGFVDAPVSGGAEGAQSGNLSFMLGGDADGIERARPLLKIMGSKITEFGPAGSGQSAKACHNMICGITALGVCEAFALAESLGLDADKFFQLCRGAAAQSWILENRCPVPGPAQSAPSSHDYAPGFAARLMAKDLKLAQQAASSSGQVTEFGEAAARRFAEFVASGQGDLDFSAIFRSIKS